MSMGEKGMLGGVHSWVLGFLLVVLAYVFVHYFIASMTAHAMAFYVPMALVAIGMGAPAMLVLLVLGFMNSLYATTIGDRALVGRSYLPGRRGTSGSAACAGTVHPTLYQQRGGVASQEPEACRTEHPTRSQSDCCTLPHSADARGAIPQGVP